MRMILNYNAQSPSDGAKRKNLLIKMREFALLDIQILTKK